MAEKTQQVCPLAPANGAPMSDEEAPTAGKEAKRKNRVKLALYIGAFAVFQVIVILVFVMVVMRVHRPKFRVGHIRVQSLAADTDSPSFNMSFVAPIRVRNTNFGPYKYDAATVIFTYQGAEVGQVSIPKSKANFKSMKKVDMAVMVSSGNLTSNAAAATALGNELSSSGTLTLRSQGMMTGKVELMLIFQKKKSTFMDCTMVISTSSRAVQSLACK